MYLQSCPKLTVFMLAFANGCTTHNYDGTIFLFAYTGLVSDPTKLGLSYDDGDDAHA